MTRRRPGFTIIELLIAMTIIAVLAGIVIPKTGDLVKRARAAAIAAEIGAIRQDLEVYYSDSTHYPPSAATGQVPAGFQGYLPLNESFVKAEYQLRYDNWTIVTTLSGHPAATTLIGLTVQTADARLGSLVMAELATLPHFQSGDEYTFIVQGL